MIKFTVPYFITAENIIDELCKYDKKYCSENHINGQMPLYNEVTICNSVCLENKDWCWTYCEPNHWESSLLKK